MRARQAARSAHHRDAFPYAGGALAGSGRSGEIEVDVVGDDQIEPAVAIVIDEGTASAPGFAGAGDSGFVADFGEDTFRGCDRGGFAVVGDVKIFPAVVVVIAHADALAPPGGGESGFDGDIREGAVMIVAVEMTGGGFALGSAFESGAIDEEDVGPAVVVVVEDGDASAGGFEDVFFGVDAAEYGFGGQAGLLGYVGEVGDAGWSGWLGHEVGMSAKEENEDGLGMRDEPEMHDALGIVAVCGEAAPKERIGTGGFATPEGVP